MVVAGHRVRLSVINERLLSLKLEPVQVTV